MRTSAIDQWDVLGASIRARRHARELTLVALAARSGLSQPFLSQIENGHARPSMESLARIATALDTTPQALFGGPAHGTEPTIVRGDHAPLVAATEQAAASLVRLLLPGAAPFHVSEFVGLPAQFHDYWQHDGFEAVYVVAGEIEIDIDGELTVLRAGDLASYRSDRRHRHRSPGGRPARVLLIETHVAGAHDAVHTVHGTT